MKELIEAQKRQFLPITSFALHPKGAIFLPLFVVGIIKGSQEILLLYFALLFLAYKNFDVPVEEKDKLLHFLAYYYAKKGLKRLGKIINEWVERFMLWW